MATGLRGACVCCPHPLYFSWGWGCSVLAERASCVLGACKFESWRPRHREATFDKIAFRCQSARERLLTNSRFYLDGSIKNWNSWPRLCVTIFSFHLYSSNRPVFVLFAPSIILLRRERTFSKCEASHPGAVFGLNYNSNNSIPSGNCKYVG